MHGKVGLTEASFLSGNSTTVIVVAVIVPLLLSILIVVVILLLKHKKIKPHPITETKDRKSLKEEDGEGANDKSVVPRLELKTISDGDDDLSRISGDLLERSRAGRPLPARAAPVDRLRQGARGDKGTKLPPLAGASLLPPLKPRAGRISSATPRVFTPRSEGSTLSPRAAWKEKGASRAGEGIPPPALYEEMNMEAPKVKKKKKKAGIMKNRTMAYNV